MARVLIVDDSAIDRRLAGGLVSRRADMEAVFAENGREALEVIAAVAPDVVLTDLQMPEMDGLELVEAVRARFPATPVVLMTAHGSEEIAVRALQHGAASYVPKRSLARELLATLDNVLDVTRAGRDEGRALALVESTAASFVLGSDLDDLAAVVGFLEKDLRRAPSCDETARIQIGVALREALANAIVHGNLEVSSELREGDGKAYDELIARRRTEAPYASRRVHVLAKSTRDAATYVVRDEGPGFTVADLPDATDPDALERVYGRGLLLIRTFMDETNHNARGNEITMVKRFTQA